MSSNQMNQLVQALCAAVESRQWETLSDRELLNCFLSSRDASAFEAIVRRHGETVLAACRRVLSQTADVDDTFQATFLVLIRQAKSIRRQQSLGSWLFGVAHRLALQARSRAARRSRIESVPLKPAEEVAPDLSWREACAILHEELDRLPNTYRMPLLLCYIDGRTRDEAAQQLGCSVGTLHGRLERGRDRLRNRLSKRGVALSVGLLATMANSLPACELQPALIQSTLGNVLSGPIPERVAALAKGAAPMFVGKVKWLAAIAVGLVAVGLGFGLPGGPHSNKDQPALAGDQPKVAEAQIPTADAKEKSTEVEVSGRVLGPDGKPFAGASLFVPYVKKWPPESEADIGIKQIGVTDAEGKFLVKTARIKDIPNGYLFATAPSTGADVFEFAFDKTRFQEVTLQLARELPITGRVVDTEGKPVVGANVTIEAFYRPADGKLDDYLELWKRDWQKSMAIKKKQVFGLINEKGKTTTDKDGRFRLEGAGVEQIVAVTVQGGGAAKSSIHVITREKFDPKPYNDGARAQTPPELRIKANEVQLFGPDLKLVVERGNTVEGTIEDIATGKPIAGVRLSCHLGLDNQANALTDAAGKYRLTGLPFEKTYRIYAYPQDKSGYLRRGVSIDAAPSSGSTRGDIKLAKGIILSGKIIDRSTGKGVQGGIRLAPFEDNKYGDKPGFDGHKTDHSMESTDKDGRFRILAIPGLSLVTVQAYGDSLKVDGQLVNPFMSAVPEPQHKDRFAYDKDDDSWQFTARGGTLEFLSGLAVVKVVDLKENSDEVKIELFVERGHTAKIDIQDADGKPLQDVVASGVTALWPKVHKLKSATATVFALDPSKPRTLFFLHPEKQLGGKATVRGDEKEPVVVKLAPLGSVAGRFLDLDAAPIAEAIIAVNIPGQNELYRHLETSTRLVKTDEQGRFTLPGVIPGVKFFVQTRKGNTYYVGEPRIGLLEVGPGKTLELGDCKLKPAN